MNAVYAMVKVLLKEHVIVMAMYLIVKMFAVEMLLLMSVESAMVVVQTSYVKMAHLHVMKTFVIISMAVIYLLITYICQVMMFFIIHQMILVVFNLKLLEPIYWMFLEVLHLMQASLYHQVHRLC